MTTMKITSKLILACALVWNYAYCSSEVAAPSRVVSSSAGTFSTPSSLSTASISTPAFPNYNTNPVTADSTGVASTATQLASKIKLGMNVGNTLEATGGETAWGNPKITKSLIQAIRQHGFNAIRLPTSWDQYANQQTAKIDPHWLQRVKEVIQYCVDNDMYVIVNIHWDGGWLETHVIPQNKQAVNAKQKAYWQQIATYLREFDEHVIFASANEPNVETSAQMEVLKSYHQTFIDAVRSTGGKNSYRVLIVQGPSTDVEKTHQLMNQLPVDAIPNKLMVEVHYYTPWNFTGMTKDELWGNQFYYWGKAFHSTSDVAHNATWGEEETVDAKMALMKQQFVDHGIPVVVGEYGSQRRNKLRGDALTQHLAGRAFYLKYVTQRSIANGLLPFYWDTGGLIDRHSNSVLDQQSLDALIQGANNH